MRRQANTVRLLSCGRTFAEAHENLGLALWKKRHLAGAATEFRAAALGFSAAQVNLGVVLGG